MNPQSEIGRIIWHDLFTPDVARARCFYADLFGWTFRVEHATDFAWRPGHEADYPLILFDGQAHGGLVEPVGNGPSYWLSWVEVGDLDYILGNAAQLGATVVREPFDVPGVGRGTVLRDPMGAVTCPFVPAYGPSRPTGVFLWDELVTSDIDPAIAFYGELFGWKSRQVGSGRDGTYTFFQNTDGTDQAGGVVRGLSAAGLGAAGSASWLTYLATEDIDRTLKKATTLGATVILEETHLPQMGRIAILTDPQGALFGIL